MSGPRRPPPNQLERVSALSENSFDRTRSHQSVTETADFAALPAALPSRSGESERLPPLPQMPARSETPPTVESPTAEISLNGSIDWDQPSPSPDLVLRRDSLAYRQPIREPLLNFVGSRNLATVGVAVLAALAMVIVISILGLRLGSDQAATTSQSSGLFNSGDSESGQGSAPSWPKGDVGVLDGNEVVRGSSEISSNQFSRSSTTRSGEQAPRPLPPTTTPVVGPLVDLEVTDDSIGSNTNLELANAVSVGGSLGNGEGVSGGLSDIEPGSVVSAAFYANCTQARAAGAAPIAKGSPGYRAALDADNDGVACETSAVAKSTVVAVATPTSTVSNVPRPLPTISATVTVRTPIERPTISDAPATTKTTTKQPTATSTQPTTTRLTTTSEKTTTTRVSSTSPSITIPSTTTVRITTTRPRTTVQSSTTAKATTTVEPTTTSAATSSSETVTSPSTTTESTTSSSVTVTTPETVPSTTEEDSDNDLVELSNNATRGNRGRALGQTDESETDN